MLNNTKKYINKKKLNEYSNAYVNYNPLKSNYYKQMFMTYMVFIVELHAWLNLKIVSQVKHTCPKLLQGHLNRRN